MEDTLQSAIALGHRLFRFTPTENASELLPLDELDSQCPDDRTALEPATALRMSHLLVSELHP